jgi:hypothetical protein
MATMEAMGEAGRQDDTTDDDEVCLACLVCLCLCLWPLPVPVPVPARIVWGVNNKFRISNLLFKCASLPQFLCLPPQNACAFACVCTHVQIVCGESRTFCLSAECVFLPLLNLAAPPLSVLTFCLNATLS